MGIVFGIGFAFGSGGAALTSIGIGTTILGARLLFGYNNGNLSVFKPQRVTSKKKLKAQIELRRKDQDYPYKEDRYDRLNKGSFFFPYDHFNRIDKRYK